MSVVTATILSSGRPIDPSYELLSVDIISEVNRIPRAELVQYYCSDWDFIVARAEANGLLVIVDDAAISLPKISIGGVAQHHFEYGRSEIFDFEIEADGASQLADVESVAWDIKNQNL